MTQAFTRQGLDAPRLSAELLLCHVLGCEKLKLYTDADRPASDLERDALRELVARALKDEPIQYLVGEWWFFGLPLRVDRRALIPRPATETIVEHVLQHARATSVSDGEGVLIADVCTGSGCVAVALASRLPRARVIATDISGEALALARENAERHGVQDRVELLEGHLLEPLRTHPVARARGSLSYLAANPPYIPDDEWDAVAPNVRDYEPTIALRGGPDGLAFVRPILESAPEFLRAGGLVLVEVADSRAERALEIARRVPGLEGAEIRKDFESLPRVVVARRSAEA